MPFTKSAVYFSIIASCGILSASCQSSKSTADTTEVATAEQLGLEQRSDATPAERADRQVAYLSERLDLRADQVDDVREIALSGAQRRADLRASGGGDRRAMMQGIRSIQEDQNAKLRAVLDDAQYDEYEEVQRELRAQLKERRGRRG